MSSNLKKIGISIMIFFAAMIGLIILFVLQLPKKSITTAGEMSKPVIEDKKQKDISISYQNEPDGFRDVKWGMNLTSNKDFEISEGNLDRNDISAIDNILEKTLYDVECEYLGSESKRYVKKNENLIFGEANVKSIYYITCAGILHRVLIKGDDLSGTIRDALLHKFGPPSKSENADRDYNVNAKYIERYYWTGSKTDIFLSYNHRPFSERIQDSSDQYAMELTFEDAPFFTKIGKIAGEIKREQAKKAAKDF